MQRKFALVSVFDKTGVIDLTISLINRGYTILSSGGTYNVLRESISAMDIEYSNIFDGAAEKRWEKRLDNIMKVENMTGFPEVLGGRVKTLQPKVHAGILADRGNPEHMKDLEDHGISPVDFVAVNLYPFQSVVGGEHTEEQAVEKVDIGGVALIRAAAKNHKWVTVMTDPSDYKTVNTLKLSSDSMSSMRDSRTRLHLARKAFQHVAEYDMAISEYFSQGKITYKGYSTVSDLKYGANPHQEAVALSEFYPQRKVFPFNIVNGSAGYINLMDAVRAWELVSEASQLLGGGAVAASFKHTTPAGVAIDGNVDDIVLDHLGMNRLTSPAARAIARARDSDPLSSFGDMVAVSHIVDDKAALVLKKEVSDGIIAPGYTDKAYQILSSKKGGKYLMIVATKDTNSTGTEIHQLAPGIVLKQERNYRKSDNTFFKNVPTSFKDIPEKAITDLILANTTLKYTPSNSVAISLDGQVVGVGAGQQNRVDCVRLACRKAATWLLRRSDQTRSIVFRRD